MNIEDRTAVISVAILADEDVNYRPDKYCVSLFGFELLGRIWGQVIYLQKMFPGD